MAITAALVKELREKTKAGMMDCKRALVEADGDMEKAAECLRKSGLAFADKKASRTTKEGIVASYIHNNNKVGVLIEVACESDFVAKNQGFQDLVRNITLQIASASPLYVNREEVPADIIEKEKAEFAEQAKGKPANIIDKIVDGKLEKFFSEVCLIDQPFVKEDKKTISELLKETIATLGENIVIKRFVRYQIG